MKLLNIQLTNFGIYEGTNIIYLSDQNINNLTLVIGKNGAGKTTLLNAIKTTFYGSLLFKVKTMNDEYQNYIVQLLNNSAKKSKESFYHVSITFISNILGFDGKYQITRAWQYENSEVKETIDIYKNQSLLKSDERDEFLNIFYQYYPIELFDLFFFDGEKIDQLSILNYDIVEVLETAFNLNLYKNLKQDLEKYAVKKVKNNELEFLEKEKDKIALIIPLKEQNRIELKRRVHEISEELFILDEKIYTLGKLGISSVLEVDNIHLKELQKDLDELSRMHKTAITDILLFLPVKQELAQLLKKLSSENKAVKYETVINELKKIESIKIAQVIPNTSPEIVTAVIDAITSNYKDFINVDKIHNITNEQLHQVRRIYNNIKEFSFGEFNKITTELNTKRKQIELVKKDIESKQSSDYKDQLEELLTSQSTKTVLLHELSSIKEELRILEIELEKLQADKEILAQRIWKQLKISNIDSIVLKTNKVLDEYINRIKHKKIQAISDETLMAFNSIIRKKNFIKKIILSEHGISFVDSKGNYLTHSQMSSGERQIFTLCLLVSILKITQRKTPLVFDTLLGRLDKKHRSKLLNRLLTLSSGQIIILATDSEVDSTIQTELGQFINKTIEIDYFKPSENMIEVAYED